MANPLMSIFGGLTNNGGIFAQAVGCMLRGESPKDFMRQIANTRPELRGMNFDDINATAKKICQQHGIDADKLEAEIRAALPK